MINHIFKLAETTPQRVIDNRRQKLRKSILRHEAEVGGKIFGPIPKGVNRQFFCLDPFTWIWYEEWDKLGKRKSQMTKYTVGTKSIVKSQDGQSDKMISAEEAKRLVDAVKTYQSRVELEVYRPILDVVQ